MYRQKDIYLLDFTPVQHYNDIHWIIKDAPDLPDCCGGNWSVLWDCLTDMIGEPLHIQVIGLHVVHERFGDTADTLVSILQKAKHYEHSRHASSTAIRLRNQDGSWDEL